MYIYIYIISALYIHDHHVPERRYTTYSAHVPVQKIEIWVRVFGDRRILGCLGPLKNLKMSPRHTVEASIYFLVV